MSELKGLWGHELGALGQIAHGLNEPPLLNTLKQEPIDTDMSGGGILQFLHKYIETVCVDIDVSCSIIIECRDLDGELMGHFTQTEDPEWVFTQCHPFKKSILERLVSK